MSLPHSGVLTLTIPTPEYSVAFRLPTDEAEAQQLANKAAESLRRAIYAYECAGYGSHVTQPLRDALTNVEFSLREVQS